MPVLSAPYLQWMWTFPPLFSTPSTMSRKCSTCLSLGWWVSVGIWWYLIPYFSATSRSLPPCFSEPESLKLIISVTPCYFSHFIFLADDGIAERDKTSSIFLKWWGLFAIVIPNVYFPYPDLLIDNYIMPLNLIFATEFQNVTFLCTPFTK